MIDAWAMPDAMVIGMDPSNRDGPSLHIGTSGWVYKHWRTQTPPDFLVVKASRYLTHMKKLKDPAEPLQRLMDHAGGREAKMGPILFQFPAQWRLNLERIRNFLAQGIDVYVYFNNDPEGHALKDAERLRHMLGR